MYEKLSALLSHIRQMENGIQGELRRRRLEWQADFAQRRIRFGQDVLERQRQFKVGLFRYLLDARLLNLLTAPLIYACFFPMLLLDLFVVAYEHICFPVYGIARVRRRDYLSFDRGHLAYLNLAEKINCLYCSYGSGLAAYLREVITRTEQYWCPIKHARKIPGSHRRYHRFVEFGDAEAYRRELESLRRELADRHDRAEN